MMARNAKEFIGQIESEAIEIDDGVCRLNFYREVRFNRIYSELKGASDRKEGDTYLKRRILIEELIITRLYDRVG